MAGGAGLPSAVFGFSNGRVLGMAARETMPKMLDPFRFALISIAGWMNQHQQHAIEYLREENRVPRAQLGNRRRFTADQRCGLAAKARRLGRKLLENVATIATPEAIDKAITA